MDNFDNSESERGSRRAFIRSIAARTAFVVPLVASFSTAGLSFKSGEAAAGGNQPIPEPSSLPLLAAGVIGVGVAAGMRKKAKRDAADSE